MVSDCDIWLLQVLISGLADNWPARHTWTSNRLLQAYGETPFRLSQRSKKKVHMRLRDYVSYMNFQHDEDPLYIFDDEVCFAYLQRISVLF